MIKSIETDCNINKIILPLICDFKRGHFTKNSCAWYTTKHPRSDERARDICSSFVPFQQKLFEGYKE